MDAVEVARALLAEADATNERRLLVLTGSRADCYRAADAVLDAVAVGVSDTALVSDRDALACQQAEPSRASSLLGTTLSAVVYDAHDTLRPNALGQVVGAVDGGGLLVLLAPPLDDWPDRRDGFDEGLAVPPFGVEDVSGRFRRRFVESLRAHPGIGIVAVGAAGDADGTRVVDDGLTDPAPRLVDGREPDDGLAIPVEHGFPTEAYAACLTTDQVEAVHDFEFIARDRPTDAGTDGDCDGDRRALVVGSDRGRGKSSAAGLAAGAAAADGLDVLVTAPNRRNAAEVFDRARELLATLDAAGGHPDENAHLVAASGGAVRYEPPRVAAESAAEPDLLVVDEAAALSVRLLDATLDADRVAYASTVHGYEGAGRGFSVRFREHLDGSDHEVRECRLAEPIRYAAGDPVEVWSFDALGLDARPPVEQVVADATPDSVSYGRVEGDDLLEDPTLLRETFGLLVLAHYRTEPDDLARLLDAPNLTVRALTHGGHVVSVALLAREGGLDDETAAGMYEGDRIRGNMIPDVLVSQVRDEAAAAPVGYRVVRIATHHAVRSSGLGSYLLDEVRAEFADDVDWLGVAYGATARLVRFWARNDYAVVHYSTTRNDVSGQYSVVMLDPCSPVGAALADRHGDWFARRVGGQLTDALDDADPDEVRASLAACDGDLDLALSEHEWRMVAGAAYGTGLFDVDPTPFRDLVVKHLVDPDHEVDLTDRQERVLVERALQAHDWSAVADDCGFHSPGQCMRALGDALVPLCDAYGGAVADEERERHA
ncbi:tRNA(Met) cytidine acetyltransferase TmcA [Haloarchaeobius iranensis]|uniref:tRNA(Met) cytidine acetyltransferase TmcA n=1 Tax=Haloarchaeobius iranensis TaxID=996166 RepID=A0A1G9U1G3_9EURY|nr:tRNA(Met) cytidine acetyltransferase TmcA [Haloarchaeobius iranensis]SDM53691.1 tRNA(Met) cytidine acetyltransferase [Haloarchaeobius iranensis]